MKVLITGGAGFIGSHVANELLAHGHSVRVLDSLIPQVHGPDRQRPAYLHRDVELIARDIREPEVFEGSLDRVDAVVHLAALVGAGQSTYRMADYTSVNNSGTACLLEALSTHPVECLVVASSMSLYGEGRYRNRAGDFVNVPERTVRQLKMGVWEVRDERGEPLTPVPTAEDKPPSLASIYALSKFDQERMCLIAGAAYEIPTVSLRLFNTYGPNQALSSPYTGVLSNFASRVLNDSAPVIYEDGLQKRDFVSVYDVARAFRLALKTPSAAGQCFNISSGQAVTVKEAAQLVLSSMGRTDIELVITGRYREGDIRHCFADTSLARKVLGWEPMMPVEEGLSDLAIWLAGQTSVDRAIEARAELAVRGLMV